MCLLVLMSISPKIKITMCEKATISTATHHHYVI